MLSNNNIFLSTTLFTLLQARENVVAQPSPTVAPIEITPTATGASPSPTSLTGDNLFSTTSRPTRSPIKQSLVNIFNDGGTHTIDDASDSFTDQSIVVSDSTTLILEEGGYIGAPTNSSWPAIRLSINSTFKGIGGVVNGSYAETGYADGGGEGIHLFNGQSSVATASYAEFYRGFSVHGGDAPDGIGGDALYVHGFGTKADIYGGNFVGGKGTQNLNGASVNILNSAQVHVYGGIFDGIIEVTNQAVITFYGCFLYNNTRLYGSFPDESELDIEVIATVGGGVLIVPDGEQECDTAPSSSPTQFPTLSPQPTVVRSNEGVKRSSFWGHFLGMVVFIQTIFAAFAE
mmetsp:Transcript_11177/g.21725  ORF Transcript_11177/g.21725 Transcript_11177/m.21725 type:complete len:346 (+) Transcript_11177:137-1174(+)